MDTSVLASAFSSVAQMYTTIFQSANQAFLEATVRPKAAAYAAYQDRLKNAWYLPQSPATVGKDETGKYILWGALALLGVLLFIKILDNK